MRSDLPFTLPANWNIIRAEEYCTRVADGTHDSPKRVDFGKKLVTSKHITGGTLNLTGAYYITEQDYFAINKRSKVDKYDILLSMIGTVGQVCLINIEPDFAIKNVGLLKNNDPVKAKWLYYWLTSVFAQQLIRERVQGTTQQYLSLNEIRNLPVPFPNNSKEMKHAVKILYDIDDKISLNTQINSTLESMAQALFKSWFVDFDPVKAKMEARANGGDNEAVRHAAMSVISGKSADELIAMKAADPESYDKLAQTADLFPEKMVESELGMIPEGWEVKCIGDLTKLNAYSWSKKNSPSEIEYVDLANTKWGTIQSTEFYNFEEAPSRARRKLLSGDTIIGTVRPGNGSYSFIKRDGLTGSTGFAVLTPEEQIYSEFVYLTTTSLENIKRLSHLADGGAYPAVSPEIISATKCILPTEKSAQDKITAAFHSSVDNLFAKIHNNITENEALKMLRDTILPKLLSGEIDLNEIDSLERYAK